MPFDNKKPGIGTIETGRLGTALACAATVKELNEGAVEREKAKKPGSQGLSSFSARPL